MDEKTLADGIFQVPDSKRADPLAFVDEELAKSLTPMQLPPPPAENENATIVEVRKSSAVRLPAGDDEEKNAVTCIADRYLLVEPIGEGGMGSVWLAEQTQPVKRQVALKLIHRERAESKMILGRFDAERQAIARMDHPHIAKLYDAGATANGSPFFVMELVLGISLTQYCDQEKLGLGARLALFVDICEAVQHAHQKGIIHRDLKPSNILVESHAGKATPKIIDFGLAKASTGAQLTDQTMLTSVGTVMGTPLYMAPEQARPDGVDVDTRADIYSLGVILYELLTGTTPLPRSLLTSAPLDEILQRIREDEAPLPSSRLGQTENLKEVAARRNLAPAQLARTLKGELDWITLKALAKERDRRYESATALGRDVERFLAQEPVSAGPPSSWYRIRKFAQRHRAQVFAASLVFLALLAGITGTTLGMLQANRAKEQADLEKQKVLAKEAEANAVIQFFAEQVLAAGRPKGEEGGQGHDVSLRDAIKASLPILAQSFAEQPLVEAGLRRHLGVTFFTLGDYPMALEQLERARDLNERYLGSEHLETLTTLTEIANNYARVGRLLEAIEMQEVLLEKYTRLYGRENKHTIKAITNLSANYRFISRQADAIQLNEESLHICKRVLGMNHRDTLVTMSNLADCYYDAGRLEKARELYMETLNELKRVFGPENPLTLKTMRGLATVYHSQNRIAEASELCKATLRTQQRVLGREHFDTQGTARLLQSIFHKAGKLDRVAELQLLESNTNDSVDEIGQETLSTYYLNLATKYAWRDQADAYQNTCRSALKAASATHYAPMADRIAKVCCLRKLDEPERAATLALARRAMALGEQHPWRTYFQLTLGMAEFRAGNHDNAERILSEVIDVAIDNYHLINTAMFYRAMNLFHQGKKPASAQLARQATAAMKPLPTDNSDSSLIRAGADDLILWLAYKEARSLIKFEEK